MNEYSKIEADNLTDAISTETMKARFILDELLTRYFDSPTGQLSVEQQMRVAVESDRIWVRLLLLLDVLKKIDDALQKL